MTHDYSILRAFTLFALLAACAGTSALAAEPEHPGNRASWGIMVGINRANMGGDMDRFGDDLAALFQEEFGSVWTLNREARTGFGIGAFYHRPLSENFGLQVEAMWIGRGTRYEVNTELFNGEIEFAVDYFEIPVLVRYAAATGKKMDFFFVLGPVVGFETSADLTVSSGDNSDTMNAGRLFESTVLSAVGGLGIEYAVGENTDVVVQFRYQLGLTDSLEDEEYSGTISDFTVFAGMGFALSR